MDGRKACCTKPENLKPAESGRADLEVKRCRVCGCRHFEATVDPGRIGMRGAELRG